MSWERPRRGDLRRIYPLNLYVKQGIVDRVATPDRVIAGKAYTSKANQAYLRRRGIKATRYDKLAVRYEAASTSPLSTNGCNRLRDRR
ncbi:hypothetical protein Pme01_27960 [Planosporangium mesophilum]|uniref:Transposase IS4-like domain-containing protein n=1 Tax=Planosporangium mesophilum TaxID=689768 RepID=A0A8J3TBB5_9ACTN|nr:hypothetical protein Pme01_27960 [Planosporangium mesophilum]